MEAEWTHIRCSQWVRSQVLEWAPFQKKVLVSPLIIDTRFSGMVHMQAFLELGSWSREITSARVLWLYDKRFFCVLCEEDSAAWSKLLFSSGQTVFQWHLVCHEKPFQSGLFWQDILIDCSSLEWFLLGLVFQMAKLLISEGVGSWVVVCIAPFLPLLNALDHIQISL